MVCHKYGNNPIFWLYYTWLYHRIIQLTRSCSKWRLKATSCIIWPSHPFLDKQGLGALWYYICPFLCNLFRPIIISHIWTRLTYFYPPPPLLPPGGCIQYSTIIAYVRVFCQELSVRKINCFHLSLIQAMYTVILHSLSILLSHNRFPSLSTAIRFCEHNEKLCECNIIAF